MTTSHVICLPRPAECVYAAQNVRVYKSDTLSLFLEFYNQEEGEWEEGFLAGDDTRQEMEEKGYQFVGYADDGSGTFNVEYYALC